MKAARKVKKNNLTLSNGPIGFITLLIRLNKYNLEVHQFLTLGSEEERKASSAVHCYFEPENAANVNHPGGSYQALHLLLKDGQLPLCFIAAQQADILLKD